MSKMNTQKSTEETTQWANLMAEIFDRLTGRGAEIAYKLPQPRDRYTKGHQSRWSWFRQC